MAIAQLLADSALGRLFRGSSARMELVVSMVGVKLGERVLVLGLADVPLLASLGAKVGLTGRACGVDVSEDATVRAQRFAERQGVLVETMIGALARPPFEPCSFDLVVVRAAGDLRDEAHVAAAAEGAHTVLRDGGRCTIIVNVARPRAISVSRPAAPGPAPDRLVGLLSRTGYLGARTLVERDGLAFVEAIARSRTAAG
jgi:hypothetical protein